MGCCGSSGNTKSSSKKQIDNQNNRTGEETNEQSYRSVKSETGVDFLPPGSPPPPGTLVPPKITRTKSQEELEQERVKNKKQMEIIEKAYHQKRATEYKHKTATIEKLNSDRSDRIEKQWTDRKNTKHFTMREIFLETCKEYPYDTYKWEQHIRSFFHNDDDFDDEEDEESFTINPLLYSPSDHNDNVIDIDGFFWSLEQLLFPIPTKDSLKHNNYDQTILKEQDIKLMGKEIEKQRMIIWKFFICDDDQLVKNIKPEDLRTYMTYDDFSGGLSGLITATVDWRSKAHKLISDTMFVVMDHDRDGYVDSHDLAALLLSLNKICGAVLNYETSEYLSKDDVEERAMALLGMNWGPNKNEQQIQYMNMRQFEHLFGALGEKHLKDLNIDNILE